MAGAYYNEIDPFAAAWLRELITAGLIADGDVDERSIEVVDAVDLRGYTQAHFFAGIGGWSAALRLAGWADDEAVWTGSCPCQPFSAAGARAGYADKRDLWPVWFRLIAECRPRVVFGEQVEAAIGHGWLDRLCDDLEREGYACGAVGLPGSCVGAFDIRQRLWFVADREADRWGEERPQRGRVGAGDGAEGWPAGSESGGDVGELADADERHALDGALQRSGEHGLRAEDRRAAGHTREPERPQIAEHCRTGSCCYNPNECDGNDCWLARQGRDWPEGEEPDDDAVELADAAGQRRTGERLLLRPEEAGRNTGDVLEVAGSRGADRLDDTASEQVGRTGQPREDFWRAADWLPCSDGKARPVEPGTFPLAHGVPARVGRLRGYGNAIKPQVAQVFIEAYRDTRGSCQPAGPGEVHRRGGVCGGTHGG